MRAPTPICIKTNGHSCDWLLHMQFHGLTMWTSYCTATLTCHALSLRARLLKHTGFMH